MVIGLPMDCTGFAAVAPLLAREHTVMTYDPRVSPAARSTTLSRTRLPSWSPTTCTGCSPPLRQIRCPCSAAAAPAPRDLAGQEPRPLRNWPTGERMLARCLGPTAFYLPGLAALRAASTRIVAGAGRTSAGAASPPHCGRARQASRHAAGRVPRQPRGLRRADAAVLLHGRSQVDRLPRRLELADRPVAT
jgi:hypothetical protein